MVIFLSYDLYGQLRTEMEDCILLVFARGFCQVRSPTTMREVGNGRNPKLLTKLRPWYKVYGNLT